VKDAVGRLDRVLVLGGDSDIGVAIAQRLVTERGARHVVLAGRDVDGIRSGRASALEAAGAQVDVVAFDARAFDTHEAFVADVAEQHGDLDVVVLAFGVLGDQARSEEEAAHTVDVLETNLVGAASVCVPIAKRLRAQGHGTLVVLSSIAGVQARRANFTYGASKAGLDAYALGLGDALAGTGASVLVVRPGFVHSKMTSGMEAAPFSTTPEAVAEATVGALDGHSNVVAVPAATRPVGWVLRALPRAVLRRLPA
jgi:decaprenylphospho-beta-D-erythro-pentofuranosid-2-ulose 2-reductase